MSDVICCVPVSPLRSEPSHRSEMVSQLLFGEVCIIIEKAPDNWIRIKSEYDSYEGWCQLSHVTAYTQNSGSSKAYSRQWVTTIRYNDQPMYIPFGSSLNGIEKGVLRWNKERVDYDGELWLPAKTVADETTIRNIAFMYLNTPYLWGGKSVFGIDCSGYSQAIFKFLGITLQRDAYQQATQGQVVGFLQEAVCGDLAFFDNEEGKITHVGLLLNDHEIIHASCKVRVDKIDNMGIVNSENNQRTHKLRIVKRML